VIDSSQSRSGLRNILIRPSNSSYRFVAEYIVSKLGYEDVALGNAEEVFESKICQLFDLVKATIRLIIRARNIDRVGNLVSFGYVSLPLRILSRLGFFHYSKSYWFSFFLHSHLWFPFFRFIINLVDNEHDMYIVFSNWEIELYEKKLGISRSRMKYLPYGSWNPTGDMGTAGFGSRQVTRRYFFAGGMSNRNYESIISCFRNTDFPLVIVCSRLNHIADENRLPSNISIYRDIGSNDFDALVAGAVCCLLPLKSDNGLRPKCPSSVHAMRKAHYCIQLRHRKGIY
jgi:hypothetical protein